MPLQPVDTVADAARSLVDVDGPVVVVPVYDAVEDLERCLVSVLAHTDPATPILVIDDASPDPGVLAALERLASSALHTVLLLRHVVNTGFVGSCNDAFAACERHDVVLVNSDVVVAAEWLDRMVAAAASSNTVATVSTLTNHGTILSVPNRNRPGPMPEGLSVDEAARRIARAATRTRPVLPTGVGHCLLVTRQAREVLGGFDEVFAPGYGEEVDFCQRAAAHGFINILADDVFVFHRGGSSFGESAAKSEMQLDHERIVDRRHPNYASAVQWAASSNRSALAAALAVARRALVGTRVAVDGMCLGVNLMGTQRMVLETAIALAAHPSVSETHLFVPVDLPDYVERAIEEHPTLVVRPIDGYEPVDDHFDAAVRPYQVDHILQLEWMRSLAAVVVVTQLDLIAYHNPAYFRTPEAWRAYREITEFTFDTVDGVAFISEHSLQEALREGLLQPAHHRQVTHCGLDHRSTVESASPPESFDTSGQFLLVLGASYLHKHRRYALELFESLAARGWNGRLVLAGATPPSGSTVDDERVWLDARPELAPRVVVMGSTSEQEKEWLLGHASLVLYPTITEGFGLVPFEAALAGTPTLTSRQGSLDEVLPPALACIPTLRSSDGLALAERLLGDPSFRSEQVEMLRAAALGFTWADSAAGLVDLLLRSLDAPVGRRSLGAPDPHGGRTGLLERVVRSSRRFPGLRRVLVGDGTRRQRALRRAANWVRRRRA